MAKKAQYYVPKSDGTYEQVYLETDAASVIESTSKSFVRKEDADFLAAQKANILKKADVVNSTTSTSTNLPASAAALKGVADRLGNVKIVVSATQPAAESGVTIIWIQG